MSVIQGGEHEEPRRDGHDLGVPQVITTWRVTGPVLVGHTADFHDQDAPIIVREADAVTPGPDGTGCAQGRCPGASPRRTWPAAMTAPCWCWSTRTAAR